MNFWKFIVVAFLFLEIFAFVEGKKAKQNEKVKVEKVKENVVEKNVHPDPPREKEPKIVIKKVKHVKEVPVIEEPEEVIIIEEVTTPDSPKKTIKPKPVKILTEYEKCKLECKKQRDKVNTQDYITQLEEELKNAKELLTQQQGSPEGEPESDVILKEEVKIIPPAKTTGPIIPPKPTEQIKNEKPIVEVNIGSTEKHDL